MPRPKKERFADLDGDFKDIAAALNEAELRDRIANVSLDQEALMEDKSQDTDLEVKREAARDAGAIYREGTKMNKLRIAYLRQMLDAKGKDTGSFEQA